MSLCKCYHVCIDKFVDNEQNIRAHNIQQDIKYFHIIITCVLMALAL